jgi:TRAP-type mannitol/chloroaromatic compound transport system permease small subunit
MKAVTGVIKAIDKITETIGKAASFLLPIIVVLQFGEVILRYVLGKPTAWSWEIATYLFGANFIVAGAWALKEEKHVRTDVLYGRLSAKWQAVLDIIVFSTVFMVFTLVMVWKTGSHSLFSLSILEDSYTHNFIPIYPLKILVFLGFVLLLLQGLAKVARDIIFLVRGEKV